MTECALNQVWLSQVSHFSSASIKWDNSALLVRCNVNVGLIVCEYWIKKCWSSKVIKYSETDQKHKHSHSHAHTLTQTHTRPYILTPSLTHSLTHTYINSQHTPTHMTHLLQHVWRQWGSIVPLGLQACQGKGAGLWVPWMQGQRGDLSRRRRGGKRRKESKLEWKKTEAVGEVEEIAV